MLYLTTRDKFDTFTAFNTIKSSTATNGGLYLPFKMPKIDMANLAEFGFGDGVALVLNQFFATNLTGKEVEFSVGRYPIRIKSAHQRTMIAELYRNLDGSYEKMERRLASKICGEEVAITSWLSIAIRIAVLFGVFAEMRKQELIDGSKLVDIALPCGDFRLPMAAWYARQIGLPIGNIVCACEHDSGVWDLLQQGQMRASNPETAFTELERLICATLGVEEAVRFSATCDLGGVYTLEDEDAKKLRSGIFCAVVSNDRVESVISNVYRTNSTILEPMSAASYSGLMDYRAKTGESRYALLLSDCSPADQAKTVAAAMNITEFALRDLLRNS